VGYVPNPGRPLQQTRSINTERPLRVSPRIDYTLNPSPQAQKDIQTRISALLSFLACGKGRGNAIIATSSKVHDSF
jgi:hypothetical protein